MTADITEHTSSAAMSRRALLRTGALGVGAAAVAGCTWAGGDRSGPTTGPSPSAEATTSDPTGSPTARPAFDLTAGTVRLNDGRVMPVLGIGTFLLSPDRAAESVETALRAGYRLIDTARIYGNEDGVGRGMVAAGVPREEVFLTTKLWTDDFGRAAEAIDESLSRLGVEYLDLLLLHHTAPDDEDAYRAMEDAVREGKVQSIGLSNFYSDDVDRILRFATVTPAVVQNETHPYFQERDVQRHIARQATVLEAWFPLGGRENHQVLFDDPTIAEIAAVHDMTPPQVLLRWHLQAGHVAIPGSGNNDHIRENIAIFDFALTREEMRRIADLDRGQRFSTY